VGAANSMAISGRKALVGTGWAVSLLLCMIGVRKQSFFLVEHPFSSTEQLDRQLLSRVSIRGCG